MYGLECQTIYVLTRGPFLCLVPELWGNEGNKHKYNTPVRQDNTYVILALIRHKESTNAYKTTISTHSLGIRFVGNVTIDCWWPKCIRRRNSYDARTGERYLTDDNDNEYVFIAM